MGFLEYGASAERAGERTLADVREIVGRASLPMPVIDRALAVFQALGEAATCLETGPWKSALRELLATLDLVGECGVCKDAACNGGFN